MGGHQLACVPDPEHAYRRVFALTRVTPGAGPMVFAAAKVSFPRSAAGLGTPVRAGGMTCPMRGDRASESGFSRPDHARGWAWRYVAFSRSADTCV